MAANQQSCFGIGDVVRLKSGGPDLLVVDFGPGYVVVAWRTGQGVAKEHKFPVTTLSRIKRPSR